MITIDYRDRKPIYEQIIERFQVLIIKGVLPAGSQMPSVRSLAVELSINPNTIQKAYMLLEQQGYIYSVKGRGSFVSETEGLVKEQKMEWQRELRDVLIKGREFGISEEECLETVRKCFGGGDL